ncbi:hypothetical protein [Clostridium estertheticum]|uniref:hypothetical protein n=1 Tax=Clostridium estertheticum TaxID=238834 RepID=UPI001CF0E7F6|nr:hypothetical protein [Clostridium estertheticum]MCB2357296.1 hypothetical protein [Clostridium estertheticum]WAG42092.1 hypothetical protein LL065_05150 [Clostridium estertheticum]
MFYEMKKFYKSTAVLIAFVLALLVAIGVPILFIHGYTSYDYSTGKEVTINGLNGLKDRKEQLQKVSGILSTDKLNKALTFYKSQPQGDKESFKMEDKYPQLRSLLTDAYSPYGQNTVDITKVSNANNFYTRNIERVKERVHLLGNGYISSNEKQEVLNKAANISKPYTLEFFDQWPILIKSLLFVYILIVLSAILISNRLFSFEKENNMDIILNSAGRKKLVRIGFQKIFAMVTYLSLEFILCTAISTAIVFGTIGITAWNSQIQTLPEFFTFIYSWSIGQMFIYSMIIAWICILSIALIGALINSTIQETYTSLIISSLLMISPIFFKYSPLVSAGIQRYIDVQPINGICPLFFVDNLFIYQLGSSKVLSSCIIVVISIIYFAIGIIFSPILFSRRINKKFN